MRSMQVIKTTAAEWGLQLPLREVLRKAGQVSAPKQANGKHNAGGHCQIHRLTTPSGHTEPSCTRHDKESLTTGGELCGALIG